MRASTSLTDLGESKRLSRPAEKGLMSPAKLAPITSFLPKKIWNDWGQSQNARLHFAHRARGIQAVVEARGKGIDVSCETCPHYLLFTEEDLERLGAVAKCAPPLRSPSSGNPSGCRGPRKRD